MTGIAIKPTGVLADPYVNKLWSELHEQVMKKKYISKNTITDLDTYIKRSYTRKGYCRIID